MSMSKMDWLVERGCELLECKHIDQSHFDAMVAGRKAIHLLAELHYGTERKNIYSVIDELLEEYHK